MRYGMAMSRIILAALALVAVTVVPASAHTAPGRCVTWTRYGTATNDTGQPVFLWDRDGIIHRHIVPAGASVPISETFPWYVQKHEDDLLMQSVQRDGWLSDQLFWFIRPPCFRGRFSS